MYQETQILGIIHRYQSITKVPKHIDTGEVLGNIGPKNIDSG